MPHSETLKMLDMMDFIRKTNGIRFPGEEDAATQFEKTSAHNESSYQVERSDEQSAADISPRVETEQKPEVNSQSEESQES